MFSREEIHKKLSEINRKKQEIYESIWPEIDKINKELYEVQNNCIHQYIELNEDDLEECLDCGYIFY